MVLITDYLSSVVSGFDHYSIVNRDKIKEVIKEQRFSLTGFADESTLSELGLILESDYVISGSLNKFGNKRRILVLKMIKVNSGEIIREHAHLYDDIFGAIDDLDYFTEIFLNLDEGTRNIADIDIRYANAKRPFTFESFAISGRYNQYTFGSTTVGQETLYIAYKNFNGNSFGYFMNAYIGWPYSFDFFNTPYDNWGFTGLIGGLTLGPGYRLEINKTISIASGLGFAYESWAGNGSLMIGGLGGDISAIFTLPQPVMAQIDPSGIWKSLGPTFGMKAFFCRIGVSGNYTFFTMLDQLPSYLKSGDFKYGLSFTPYISMSAIF